MAAFMEVLGGLQPAAKVPLEFVTNSDRHRGKVGSYVLRRKAFQPYACAELQGICFCLRRPSLLDFALSSDECGAFPLLSFEKALEMTRGAQPDEQPIGRDFIAVVVKTPGAASARFP
jgi:hypothetical protein